MIGPATGDSLHVMSFNLRYASTRRPNSWAARRPVAELLRREQPTVLGTQEGLYAQLRDLVTYDTLVGGTDPTDTWLAVAERHTPLYATFHGYRPPVPGGVRIDWILTRGATVLAAAINTFSRDGQFPSDHLPVQALVTLD